MNGARRVDYAFCFTGPRGLPAHHLVQGAGAGEIAGGGVRNLAVDEMDFAAAALARAQMQNRRSQVEALQRNQVANIQIAAGSSRIARSRVCPWAQQGLDGGSEFSQLERFFDELNRV